ncbi:MAG: glycosyltransferase [Cyanobacteria bacterium J06597_16]
MTRKFIVNVVTGQGGGGHYATYHALRAIAAQQNLPWEFQVTDMDEIITGLSASGEVKNAYEMFGFSGHDLYNLMVKGGWTWLWPLKMRLNKLLVRLNYNVGVKKFTAHWQQQQPDLVVSVMPLYNKGLWESLQQAKPKTPYVTVLTDFADCPPDFWFDTDAGNTLVCGTQRAVDQARSLGISEDRIVQSSGLVVHPTFYEKRALSDEQKSFERQRLGLLPAVPTGLVTFGGNGSDTMLTIADKLAALGRDIQLIFMCGRNQALADELNNYQGPQKRLVVGFTDHMASYMSLSDFMIGKPGNVSISEAVVMKLPIITQCSATTMSQERYCAEWVMQKEIGLVVRSFKGIDQAVGRLLSPGMLAQYQRNLEGIHNQAGFEVIDLLNRLLTTSGLDKADTQGKPETQTAAAISMEEVRP